MGWSEEDRAKWWTWQIERRERCNRCGSYEWEWDGAAPWEAGVNECAGCVEVETLAERMGASKNRLQAGQSVRLYRRGN